MREEQLTILFSIPTLELRNRLLEAVQKHGGHVLKTFGDAYVFGFTDPKEACDTALSFRQSIPPEGEWRAGIAFGDVTVAPSDVFGEAVNVAARLEGVAAKGEVLAAESIRLVTEGMGVHLADLGPRTFKGMPQPVRIFSLQEKAVSPPPMPVAIPVPTPAERMPQAEQVPQTVQMPLKEQPIPAPAPKLSVVPPSAPAKQSLIRPVLAGTVVFLALIGGGMLLRGRNSSAVAGNFATLTIRSTPDVASIFVENKEVAKQTPVKINQVPPNRSIKIRVQKDGFEDSMQVVKLTPKESRIVEVTLKPLAKKGARR